MRKMFLSFVLVISLVLTLVPFRASAVLPIGFAQAALASYVSSTGYKMYQDQAVGDSILLSLSELYDLFRENTLQGAATDFALDTLLASFQIRQDNSGNVVVSKMAADVFQQFSDWLQSEYSIPDNNSNPTYIPLSESNNVTSADGNIIALACRIDSVAVINNYNYYYSSVPFGSNANGTFYIANSSSSVSGKTIYLTRYGSNLYIRQSSNVGYSILRYSSGTFYLNSTTGAVSGSNPSNKFTSFYNSGADVSYIPYSLVNPSNSSVSLTPEAVQTLGLSIAQSVIDQAAKADEDDAVVIGVGAQAGATAQEIADLIAQGINARTLDPSVTVVAEVAIDTPVQQFPDQDDLGLPKLGLALVRRFPFCIPFDLVDTWQLIVHYPIEPVMTVDIIPASFKQKVGITANTSFDINFASPQWSVLLFLIRWGCLIGFCLALEQLTKRYIWTTGG